MHTVNGKGTKIVQLALFSNVSAHYSATETSRHHPTITVN